VGVLFVSHYFIRDFPEGFSIEVFRLDFGYVAFVSRNVADFLLVKFILRILPLVFLVISHVAWDGVFDFVLLNFSLNLIHFKFLFYFIFKGKLF
jgi:hypothetical protein